MDKKAIIYKGIEGNYCCCDQALRILPGGDMYILHLIITDMTCFTGLQKFLQQKLKND